MSDIISTVLVFLALLSLSAIFSASETALTGANRIRLKNQSETGDKKAKRALKLIDNYDTTLDTLLVGNNIVNTLLASYATVVCTKLIKGSGAVGVATAAVTVLVVIFGEVIPKSFANSRSEAVSKVIAAPINAVKVLFTPVSFALEGLKKLVIPKKKKEASVTEDELKVIIEEIEDEGVIEEEQSELLQSALEFSDITVDEIITPRVDIFGVEETATQQEILDMFLEQRFSRLPVFKKSVDNIIGVINQKDYFAEVLTHGTADLKKLMQPCVYVPPKKHIDRLMSELQRKKLHMAVVTDQYGGTLGIVTLEDILEELVGEIWDEHDEVTYMLLPLGENRYEVSGEMTVEELFESLAPDEKVPETDAASVAGFALEMFGHIPEPGEKFEYGPFEMEIAKVDELRIIKLIVTVHKTEQTDEKEKD